MLTSRHHQANTSQSFWELTSITKLAEQYKIDQNLQYLKWAPLATLKKIFIQYRFFTQYYITDLALLISKLPFGQLRSILAEILNEELGNGNATQAHPNLYDQFLMSIGIPQESLNVVNLQCIQSLHQIQQSLLNKPWAYGVGLRGLGGECLCQIYLSTMHKYFSQNSAITHIQAQIAWTFWDIHIGEVELHHKEIVRAAINDVLATDPDVAPDLINGYLESKTAWDNFWQHIFASARNNKTR